MNPPLNRTLCNSLLLLVVSGSAGACTSAARSGGAELERTERGSAAIVTAVLDSAGVWTRDAFSDFNIRMQEVSRLRNGRTFKGSRGAREVTADLKPASATATRVEITVRKDLAGWDTLYARKVLRRIVQRQR